VETNGTKEEFDVVLRHRQRKRAREREREREREGQGERERENRGSERHCGRSFPTSEPSSLFISVSGLLFSAVYCHQSTAPNKSMRRLSDWMSHCHNKYHSISLSSSVRKDKELFLLS
jgi:hypothetical protein